MYRVRNTILLIGLLWTFLCQAQDKSFILNGKVSDEIGEPMVGVNVLIEGTQRGTVTDTEGNFQLEVQQGMVLQFSHVGYLNHEIAVGSETTMTASLSASLEMIDEIVVIGYGTRRKKNVTGAVSKLKEEEFNQGIIVSPEQLMQGKMAGVDVIRSSGEPGAAFTVRIRGANTIRAGNDPLYVIDGYPLDINSTTPGNPFQDPTRFYLSPSKNPLSFLNPDDIKSIEVLKDASATAIYGARGANGVVMITTKTGVAGKPRISYSIYGSLSELRKEIDVATPEEFREAQLVYGFSGKDLGDTTDWHDEIFQTAFTHNHDLSISGGGPSTDYRVSLNFLDQEGIIKSSELQRFTGRTNIHQEVIDQRLSLDLFLTLSRIKESRPPPGIADRINSNPTWSKFDIQNGILINPTATIEMLNDEITTNRLLTNLTASLQLLESLQFKINTGGSISTATRRTNESTVLAFNSAGLSSIAERELGNFLFESYLTYNKTFSSQHRLGLLGGYSYQEFRVEDFLFSRGGFTTDEILGVDNIGAGTTEEVAESGKEKSGLQSLFGRLDYAFREKYLLTVNFRRDGSTRFGENNKYGNFPSFAAAWLLSDEPFMDNAGFLDMLKLRLSWGLTGNQEIPNKISQTILAAPFDATFILDESGKPIQGFTFVRTPNPDLKWEETRQIDIGMEFSFFEGRLEGEIDYFDKATSDLLLEVPTAAAPTTLAWTNLVGEVSNSGWEFGLGGVPITGGKFNWETSVNFTTINNEVSGMITPLFTNNQIITNGFPLGTFYGPRWLQFDDNGFDVFKTNLEGKEALGSALPNFTWGFTNTFNYGKFDLAFMIHGSQGNKIYSTFLHRSLSKQGFGLSGRNSTLDNINSEENFTNANLFSSRHIVDGSFIRLNYLTLGFSLDTSKINWLNLFRIYFTGTNLFVITDFLGFDPETNTNTLSQFNSDRFGRPEGIPPIGIDSKPYPRARSIQVGIQVSFL